MLTFQRAKELLSYDPQTGVLKWKQGRRNGTEPGANAGFASKNGYVRLRIDGVQHLAHRVAWLIHYSAWPAGQVDHKDTNRANNAISNLRVCTGAQNQQNQNLRKTNRSGVKGVSWVGPVSKWQVQVRAGGKIHHGGYHANIDDAEAAAIQLRTQLHGEFARHK